MKLERLFEVKDNKLYKVSGEEVSPEGKAFPVKWSEVEAGAEEYNEDYLAKLREDLKSKEEKKEFVFIEPVFDKDAGFEQFTAAMKHTARRIKDCVSVIGFAIPDAVVAQKDYYIEELSAKHGHYCFFCKQKLESSMVLY
ncbi:MAG: 23S rRNA (adenine(2030)-N(6))-methyltransferase RlmJ [Treponema sp.]|nr:23S rRNA (adenine(2030)-N(6))-methyltransferase RlmJ [Treponema sp.]